MKTICTDLESSSNCATGDTEGTKENLCCGLWGQKLETIVSSEILGTFYSEFSSLLPTRFAELDLYSQEMSASIDEINS